jgi:long-subunit fatty acid transport protein
LGLNLSYQINPHFSVDAGYNYDNVQTQLIGYGYTRNRVYLGVTATY